MLSKQGPPGGRELFGWNLTAYPKWCRSQNVRVLLTDALDEDFVQVCHECPLRDEVCQTYRKLQVHNRLGVVGEKLMKSDV